MAAVTTERGPPGGETPEGLTTMGGLRSSRAFEIFMNGRSCYVDLPTLCVWTFDEPDRDGLATMGNRYFDDCCATPKERGHPARNRLRQSSLDPRNAPGIMPLPS